MKNRKISYKRIAWSLSLCALILWGVLGTGTSLAWFTDSEEINNIFHFAEFDLTVSHYSEPDGWSKVEGDTKLFHEEDLFEPGHVQVVYLEVKNNGSVPFDFYSAVNVNDCVIATNVFGLDFMLQDYLKFGVITGLDKSDIENGTVTRALAKDSATTTLKEIADLPLHQYATETARLAAGQTTYLALIVRMPEEVGNLANYRGTTVPKVELGITVKADQIQN